MIKLELKHLSPYLPYGLKVYNKNNKVDLTIVGCTHGLIIMHNEKYSQEFSFDKFQEYNYKPILHPLSDLTEEIEHNGKKFVPTENKNLIYIKNAVDTKLFDIQQLVCVASYSAYQKMFEWHFDVFGLIPEGLAIDINTLKEVEA